MRGGLDDALEKLARRDELRRRAAGEPTGTPPAVTELVEAIAAVVGHHPDLGVTVGVEGAGEPLLLHFYYGDGQVQVNAENAVAVRSADPASPAPRHADVVVDAEEAEPELDDRYHAESDTAERRYGSFDTPPNVGESSRDLGARMRDLGMATTRGETEYPPHPFAATPPPPVPPRTTAMPERPTSPPPVVPYPAMSAQPTSAQPTSAQPTSAQPTSAQPTAAQPASARSAPAHMMPPAPRPPVPPQPGPSQGDFIQPDYNATRRIRPEQHRAHGDSSATERIPHQQNGMPRPLPKPVPLQVERPEETEMAARRLAALLRDDPSLLSQPPD